MSRNARPEKRGGKNDSFPGCAKNLECGPAPSSCLVNDPRRDFPGLKIIPWPEPSPIDEATHCVWRKQYLEWRAFCKCPCGRGYFCREHGMWVNGMEAKDKSQGELDMFGYPNCPRSHFPADGDNAPTQNTGLENDLSSLDVQTNDTLPPEMQLYSQYNPPAQSYPAEHASDSPWSPPAPAPGGAQASEKNQRSSKRVSGDSKRHSTKSSTSSKPKVKSKGKNRAQHPNRDPADGQTEYGYQPEIYGVPGELASPDAQGEAYNYHETPQEVITEQNAPFDDQSYADYQHGPFHNYSEG